MPPVHSFPGSTSVYDRSRSGELALRVIHGALPADCRGLVYVVAPTGRVREGAGRHDRIPFLNGDGTVYRIALDAAAPKLAWRLCETPCQWAEDGTEDPSRPQFSPMRFRDWGITRLSDDLLLGGRNLLNTALQAMRFGGSTDDRLLVTYESGRPFEIDPVSLELLTPIGVADAWEPTMLGGTPFEVVAATSHPAFDPGTDAQGAPGPGTLFLINYRRATTVYLKRLGRLFGASWLDAAAIVTTAQLVALLLRPWTALALPPGTSFAQGLAILDAIKKTAQALLAMLPRRGQIASGSAQLLWWHGDDEPKRCTLLHEDGTPLELVESAHQMAVTEDYVVFTDAAFKFEMDLVVPYLGQLALPDSVIRWFRERLSRVQPQATPVFLVPRSGLVDGGSVRVKRVVLDPCSSVHYFVDRAASANGRVVIHAIDNAATDSSEFLVESDLSMFPTAGQPLSPAVRGMMPSAVDRDRVARWEIDPAAGTATRTHEHSDPAVCWTVALATGPGIFTAEPRDRLEHFWFYTHGFLPDAMSQLVWNLYDGPEYPRRIVPVAQVRALAQAGGEAPRIARYETSSGTIADSYAVPAGWLALSPQYVPVAGRTAPDGYLVATAFGPGDHDKEIWIFDAARLAQGPICKLAAGAGEHLPWGYTLHSTWIERAVPSAGTYRVPVAADLPPVVGPLEQQLIDDVVIPNAYT